MATSYTAGAGVGHSFAEGDAYCLAQAGCLKYQRDNHGNGVIYAEDANSGVNDREPNFYDWMNPSKWADYEVTTAEPVHYTEPWLDASGSYHQFGYEGLGAWSCRFKECD